MGTVTDPEYQIILADGKTDTQLADVTGLVTATIQPRISRPLTVTLSASEANDPKWYTHWTDGHPNLSVGDRIVKVYRNGTLIANTEVWRCDWSGNENTQSVQITCYDPMIRTPFHYVRDDDGRFDGWKFVDPSTYSNNPTLLAGATVQRILRNADTFDDHGIGDEPNIQPAWYTGPRQFPIDYSSGDFSASANIFDLFADGPVDCGTFIYNTVADTGVCDIVCLPTETALGAIPGVYGIVSVVNKYGSDKSGTVHFDYHTGDNSIREIARSMDMATVANRLKYLLGPKSNRPDHWPGTIDQPIAANHDNDEAFVIQPIWDEMWLSRERYGLMYSMRSLDSEPTNTVRWLFHALFNTEIALRLGPRELIAIIPSTDCEFRPWDDYNIGDIVALNLAQTVGPATLSDPRAQQRIYGFDVEIDVNGVETVTAMYNSADAITTTVGPAS